MCHTTLQHYIRESPPPFWSTFLFSPQLLPPHTKDEPLTSPHKQIAGIRTSPSSSATSNNPHHPSSNPLPPRPRPHPHHNLTPKTPTTTCPALLHTHTAGNVPSACAGRFARWWSKRIVSRGRGGSGGRESGERHRGEWCVGAVAAVGVGGGVAVMEMLARVVKGRRWRWRRGGGLRGRKMWMGRRCWMWKGRWGGG